MTIDGFITVLEQWQFMARGSSKADAVLIAVLSIVFGSVLGLTNSCAHAILRLSGYVSSGWPDCLSILFVPNRSARAALVGTFFALPHIDGSLLYPISHINPAGFNQQRLTRCSGYQSVVLIMSARGRARWLLGR